LSLPITFPVTLRSLGRGFHVVPDAEIERASMPAAPPPIDYAPLADAAQDVALWLLDVARSQTSDPLDLTAIDRVQRAAMAAFANTPIGSRPAVTEEDVLTVAGILLAAFEVDLGVPGLGAAAGSLYDATDGDLASICDVATDVIAARAAASMVAARSRTATATRSPFRSVPVVARRRPRIVDEAALADALGEIHSTR
jgi:hypothetical protein